MTNQFLVSIIIPVYGVKKWIERCLLSALSQDYDNIEIIIVDDKSIDGSSNIINKVLSNYKGLKKIILISHKYNKGLAKARETGIKAANGEFIFHLDGDDWLEYNSISTLISFAEQQPDLDIISGNYRNIYNNKQIDNTLKISDLNPRQISLHMMEMRIFWNIWNRLIKKNLYNNLLIPSINNGEDYITTSRLFYKARNVLFIDIITYNYNHLNENSFQKNLYVASNISDRINSVEFLIDEFKGNSQVLDSLNIGYLKAKAKELCSGRSRLIIKQININKSRVKLKYLLKIKITYTIQILLKLLNYDQIILFINRFYKILK